MELKDLTATIETMAREWKEMQETLTTAAAGEKERFGEVLGDTSAKLDKFNDRLDQLEVKLNRPAPAERIEANEMSPARKAFDKYARSGPSVLTPDEAKLLIVSDDTTGGFRAPAEFDQEIIKGIVEVSPVRSIVTVRPTSKRSIKVMKRTGQFAAVWVSESGTRAETTGLAYGMEEIPNHEIYALVDVSVQDLEDTDFDLEGELRQEAIEQFALAEGVAVITGNGDGKPEGFMVNAAVSTDNTGHATLLQYNGLMDVSHNGKAAYATNGTWVFNLKTLGAIRKMLDGAGSPLWAPLAAGAPSTVLGRPYSVLPGMADVGAGAKPIAFGDFRRAYRLVDRVSIQVVRDELTQATSGAVRFLMRKRLGGQVVLAEAFRTQTVSA